MANHVLYDSLWESDRLAGCSREAALAYPWIFLVADDHGRFEFKPRMVWKHAFSYRTDVTVEDVAGWLEEYWRVGLLIRYGATGDLAHWYKFKGRKPSDRKPSGYADPEGLPVLTYTATPPPRRGDDTAPPPPRGGAATPPPRGGGKPAPEIDQIGSEVEQIGRQSGVTNGARSIPPSEASVTAYGPDPCSSSKGVPEEQRGEYAEAVWQAFINRTKQPTRLMSPQEFSLLKRWMDEGVPLRVVLRGISETRATGRLLNYFESSVRVEYERVHVALSGTV